MGSSTSVCPAPPILDSTGTQIPEVSTLQPWIVHVLFIVPPLVGLLWTLICHIHVSHIEVSCEEEEGDEGETTELFNENCTELLKSHVGDDESYADKMNRIAGLIKDGSITFLMTEYKYMAVFVFFMSIIIGIFYWYTNPALMWGTVFAFIVGSITSILCGYIGMQAAVNCNVRTTFYCWKFGAMKGLDVALRGGSIMGFGLCSIGVLVLYALIMFYRSYVFNGCPLNICEALAGFGLGGSSIALFGRVGGGIYTKAADVGADLSGKIDQDMPEDSPYNPACIADNVGDNVGDIAGMGADLFGSFAESTVAALVIAASVTDPNGLGNDFSGLYFPVLVSSSGIVVGFVTILVILQMLGCLTSQGEDINGIERALKYCLIVSTFLQTPVVIALGLWCLPANFVLPSGPATPWGAIICLLIGLWSGLIIGLVTEYYTSHSYSPVRDLAGSQLQSAATGIIFGLALGYLSCIVPVVLLAIVIVTAHTYCGMYGVALAALGMLSTLTLGLTIDAYGPISDNAGGIAEMSELNEEVRSITDALDAAGNTTAAIGKGFAIGSAALVGLALFGAFKVRAEIGAVDVAEPWTFAGLLIGALLPYAFSAMTMKSVALAANQMVEECKEQIPLILERKARGEDPAPDYTKCIQISTDASLREMIMPGLLVILSPLVMGLAFGKNCCAGLLCGALVSGVQLAISMSNSGGAWDNSKKFIKQKDSPFLEIHDLDKNSAEFKEAHKNSVTGDTVGDPLKDTSGPSLNILVKLSAITSLVFAGVIKDWSNANGGPLWIATANTTTQTAAAAAAAATLAVCATDACVSGTTAFSTQQVCAEPICTTAECCYTPGICPANGLCTAARPSASSPTTCASTTCTIDECCDAAPCTITAGVTNAATAACTGETGATIADTTVCTVACVSGFVAAPTTVTCASGTLPAFTCPAVGTCPAASADGQVCTTARPIAASPRVCASTTCTIEECCDAAPGSCTIPAGVTNAATAACTGETGATIVDTTVCTGACMSGFVAAPTTVTCASGTLPAFTCPAVGTCPAAGAEGQVCTAARPIASSPRVCASTTCTIEECCDPASV